jgi:predicted DNA-binding protein (UPF0251 family)/predicted Fe-Mo cluster-binding NifX family protein
VARPVSERRLGAPIPPRVFKPAGIPARELEELRLGFDEAEALRLADYEGLYHEAAARSMGVSRQTFGRIVERARRKVAAAIIEGKALRVDGGAVSMNIEGVTMMKIAVPARDGLVDEHFGHCKEFLVFRDEGGKLVQEKSMASPEGCGCKSGVAADLAKEGVTVLVAGNMGEGAVRVLSSHGIKVVRGASGDARLAARAFADGSLSDSERGCTGHGEGGECGH